MALDENGSNGMVMPVGPIGYGGGYGGYGGGFGVPYAVPVLGGYGGFGGGYGNGFGGDLGWLVILFLFAAMGGNGFGGFGGFGNGLGFDFPWLLNGQNQITASTADGFRSAAISSQLGDIQTSITTGFSNSEVAACNRAIDALQTSYNNQIAALNRSFDAQTALDTRLDGISSDLQKCCCDNELRTEQLRFTVATENAADREALSNGIRDILTAQTAGTQRILDQLCQDKIDEKNERIAELQTQVNMQNLAASQAAQTAALVADNTAQTATLINRIAPYPVPAYPAFGYGNCYGNNGWGWGNFGFNGFNGLNPFGNVGFGNGSF